MILKELREHADLGLLISRIGIGLSYIFIHGWSKMFGGPEAWQGIGGALGAIINFEILPTFFGFLAAVSEFVGGILVLLGLFFRPACIALALTMLVATLAHILPWAWGDSWGDTAHSLKMLFVFIGLIFVGPGEYSVDGGDMLE